ncbi:VOC family protein [Chitinophaga nivalis]|uniref:VOC family protein n=1 Tax=Chitinophaga nivalis TaxID=2991709 RepID=A0ABT3IJZ0_9BACT|nr:VOC family protein [Chitinophaga nivalis]MCW3466045.1 VOC family protein [Chitinophaga nivalis]MCW3484264.1 VOC family protein [Chitinophaga nivalis]
MRLSHVLFKVRHLHTAVEKLTAAGFNVEYGTRQDKAYNAMIWLADNVFVEIYENPGLPFYVRLYMRWFGYKAIAARMDKWQEVQHGWCEWSVESELADLAREEQLFTAKKVPYKTHIGKRTNTMNQLLSWHLIFPDDYRQPFIMSAYTPDPRPAMISHPNGITAVDQIMAGEEHLDKALYNDLHLDWTKIKLIPGKSGLQTVIFRDSTLRIEDVLG